MIKKLKAFLKTTILGGLIVLLPVVLTWVFLEWAVNLVTGLIQPLSQKVVQHLHLHKILADVIVVAVIVAGCFIIGLLVKTRVGGFIYRQVEKRILKVAPGYSLFRETIKQFLGQERAPFSQVALVRAFESGTLMTGFVTDEHPDGRYTVFVPSGLNPTSGVIYHLEGKNVHLVDVSVEDTMRSIISCGAGSKALVRALKENKLPGKKNDR